MCLATATHNICMISGEYKIKKLDIQFVKSKVVGRVRETPTSEKRINTI